MCTIESDHDQIVFFLNGYTINPFDLDLIVVCVLLGVMFRGGMSTILSLFGVFMSTIWSMFGGVHLDHLVDVRGLAYRPFRSMCAGCMSTIRSMFG